MCYLIFIATLIIFNIFFSSGINKILKFEEFLETVAQFSGIRNLYILKTLASFVISIETIGSIAILFFPSFSSLILLVLIIIFNILITKNLYKKNLIKCNCGGLLGNKVISVKILYRNLLIIIILFLPLFGGYSGEINSLDNNFNEFFKIEFILVICWTSFYLIKNIEMNLSNIRKL